MRKKQDVRVFEYPEQVTTKNTLSFKRLIEKLFFVTINVFLLSNENRCYLQTLQKYFTSRFVKKLKQMKLLISYRF